MKEYQALSEASKILNDAARQLCNEPMPIFMLARNARNYIDAQLKEKLRSESN